MTNGRLKIDVPADVIRQIATRRALGVSLRDLEAEFGISRPVVNRVLNSELGREVTKGIIEDAVKGAVASIRTRLADMTELCMEALEHNLKEKKMDAVKEYFSALGIRQAEKAEGSSNQSIQVIFPGQAPPKDIEIEK